MLSRPKESPLHFDPDDNLMLQLRGEKTFLMYDAAQAPNLHVRMMRGRDDVLRTSVAVAFRLFRFLVLS